MVNVTAAVMTRTALAIITATAGSSRSGCDQKATAPFREVSLIRSSTTAMVTPQAGRLGP